LTEFELGQHLQGTQPVYHLQAGGSLGAAQASMAMTNFECCGWLPASHLWPGAGVDALPDAVHSSRAREGRLAGQIQDQAHGWGQLRVKEAGNRLQANMGENFLTGPRLSVRRIEEETSKRGEGGAHIYFPNV
jgi:hypothetical protein